MRSAVVLSGTGCLVPFLIILNLIFGWMFLKPLYWFLLEAILLLIFWFNSLFLLKKMVLPSGRHKAAIDIEGEVVKEDSARKRMK